MATLQENNDNTRSMEWIAKFFENMAEGERKDISLFRLETFLSDIDLFYMSYIHPAVGMIYILVISLTAYMISKLKISSFIINIFVLCSLIKCIPRILLVPLHLVFTMYFNVAAPMLYPWCLIYSFLYDTMMKVTHVMSINLNILLAINRCCSVYHPFQTKLLFSKTRNIIYCSLIIILTSLVILTLNYRSLDMPKELAIGDMRNNRKLEIYPSCSLQNAFLVSRENESTTTPNNTNLMIEVFIVLVCTVCLGILDVILLKKLWMMRHRQISSFDGPKVLVRENSNRMLLLNKISCFVISGVVLMEIPNLVIFVISIVQGFSIQTGGVQGIIEKNEFVDILSIIMHDLFAPMDVILFLVSSKKVRNHLKEKLCVK